MTKQEILYNNLSIISYDLHTQSLRTTEGAIATYYWVTWNSQIMGEIRQEITKSEYDVLLAEL